MYRINFKTTDKMKEQVSKKFQELYGEGAVLFASPGRINLIGEHTDYNGGFVFPGAVDKGIVAAIRLNGTDRVRAYALDLGESSEFGLREEDKPAESWARYIFGVCREVQKRGGKIGGFDTVFAGDVPLGAGMSSSAALESTYAFALNDLFGCGIDKFELAKIGQATEHNYCGVNCGIMDQFASVFGKKGCLMRLDCRSLEYAYFPFDPKGYRLVLVDSRVKHELVGSPYNDRRASCERVAGMLGQEFLRGATMEQLDAIKDKISEEDYKRARYVIGEEKRVLDAQEARSVVCWMCARRLRRAITRRSAPACTRPTGACRRTMRYRARSWTSWPRWPRSAALRARASWAAVLAAVRSTWSRMSCTIASSLRPRRSSMPSMAMSRRSTTW